MSDAPATNDLQPRVAVLEEMAASTKQILAEIRNDMRDMRTGLHAELRDLRTEMHDMRTDLKTDIRDVRTDLRDMRQRQERDFRLLFGAIILVAIGLAGLIARTQHWI